MAGDLMSLTTLISTLQDVVRAINNLNQTASTVFPQVAGTSDSAIAGTNGAIPAQVAGYVEVVVNGSTVKIPFYPVS